MALPGWFASLWLTRFSRPAGERPLWQHLLRTPPKRILEIGLGGLSRTERMLSLLGPTSDGAPIQYVGIDRFESRTPTDPPGVTLKAAHQRLTPLAKIQLVPGNADSALARVSNHLGVFDLVLVSADDEAKHLERSWFFVQRLVRPTSTILVEPAPGRPWEPLEAARLEALASLTVQRRAAA